MDPRNQIVFDREVLSVDDAVTLFKTKRLGGTLVAMTGTIAGTGKQVEVTDLRIKHGCLQGDQGTAGANATSEPAWVALQGLWATTLTKRPVGINFQFSPGDTFSVDFGGESRLAEYGGTRHDTARMYFVIQGTGVTMEMSREAVSNYLYTWVAKS